MQNAPQYIYLLLCLALFMCTALIVPLADVVTTFIWNFLNLIVFFILLHYFGIFLFMFP